MTFIKLKSISLEGPRQHHRNYRAFRWLCFSKWLGVFPNSDRLLGALLGTTTVRRTFLQQHSGFPGSLQSAQCGKLRPPLSAQTWRMYGFSSRGVPPCLWKRAMWEINLFEIISHPTLTLPAKKLVRPCRPCWHAQSTPYKPSVSCVQIMIWSMWARVMDRLLISHEQHDSGVVNHSDDRHLRTGMTK